MQREADQIGSRVSPPLLQSTRESASYRQSSRRSVRRGARGVPRSSAGLLGSEGFVYSSIEHRVSFQKLGARGEGAVVILK